MAKGTDAPPRRPSREGQGTPSWALSPTDLTFLWDECPHCFYKKVVLKRPRARSPFPKVFGAIDRAMKTHYVGKRSEVVIPGMAPGVIGGGDRWVTSAPITVPGCDTPVVIRGRVDALVNFDDTTTGVLDFKTAEPKSGHLALYARQLHSYAWALEHPARGAPTTVSALDLLCFVPRSFDVDVGDGALRGGTLWIPVERDDHGFGAFLRDVVSVLEGPDAPPPDTGCEWCEELVTAPER